MCGNASTQVRKANFRDPFTLCDPDDPSLRHAVTRSQWACRARAVASDSSMPGGTTCTHPFVSALYAQPAARLQRGAHGGRSARFRRVGKRAPPPPTPCAAGSLAGQRRALAGAGGRWRVAVAWRCPRGPGEQAPSTRLRRQDPGGERPQAATFGRPAASPCQRRQHAASRPNAASAAANAECRAAARAPVAERGAPVPSACTPARACAATASGGHPLT